MSISSHMGMVLLVVVGMATIFAIIIIAAVEAKRMDNGKHLILPNAPETTAVKKK